MEALNLIKKQGVKLVDLPRMGSRLSRLAVGTTWTGLFALMGLPTDTARKGIDQVYHILDMVEGRCPSPVDTEVCQI